MPKKLNNISVYLTAQDVQKIEELRALMLERSLSSTIRKVTADKHYELIAQHRKTNKE